MSSRQSYAPLLCLHKLTLITPLLVLVCLYKVCVVCVCVCVYGPCCYCVSMLYAVHEYVYNIQLLPVNRSQFAQ